MTMPSRPHVVSDPMNAPGFGSFGQNAWATNRLVELMINEIVAVEYLGER